MSFSFNPFTGNLDKTSTGTSSQSSWSGSGTSDDSASFQAFLDAGGGRVKTGTYVINSVDITNVVDVYVEAGTTFQLNGNFNSTTLYMIRFSSGSEGSVWNGGVYDGLRNTDSLHIPVNIGDDATIYSHKLIDIVASDITLTIEEVKRSWYYGIYASGSEGSELTGLDISCIRATDNSWAYNFRYINDSDLGPLYCQSGSNLENNSLVRGSKFTQISNCKMHDLSAANLDQDAFARATLTGVGFGLNVEDSIIDRVTVVDFISAVYNSIGITTESGCKGCAISNLVAKNFCGTGISLIQEDCVITNVYADGYYKKTTALSAEGNQGVLIMGIGIRPEVVVLTDQWQANHDLGRGVISNIFATRCGIGINVSTTGYDYSNCKATANLVDGWYFGQYVNSISIHTTFVSPPVQYSKANLYGCSGTYNGRLGLNTGWSDGISVNGGEWVSNGQVGSYADSLQAAFGSSLATNLTGDVQISSAKIADGQGAGTIVNIISWTTRTSWAIATQSWTPNDDFWVVKATLIDPQYVHVGQSISIVHGQGISTPLDGMVIDMIADDIWINVGADNIDFDLTGNLDALTALTGTWTIDGTDPYKLVGTGGNADAEVNGHYWIRVSTGTEAGQQRQVRRQTDDDAIYLDEDDGFATLDGLSGDTLEKIEDDVTLIPSQHYGISLLDASLQSTSQLFFSGIFWADSQATSYYNIDVLTHLSNGSELPTTTGKNIEGTIGADLFLGGEMQITDLTAGLPDALDVTGISVIRAVTSAATITIGGLVGGVDKQRLTIYKPSVSNDLVIEDFEGGGNQDIFTPTSASDVTLSSRGGVTMECDGSDWYLVGE